MSEPTIETLSIASPRPYPKNARTHSRQQVWQIGLLPVSWTRG